MGGKKQKKKNPLLYKKLLRLLHMEFNYGNKTWLILMMQKKKNSIISQRRLKKNKPLLPVFSCCFAFLLSIWRLGNGVVSHLIDVALILVILMMIIKKQKTKNKLCKSPRVAIYNTKFQLWRFFLIM